jgi:hypothetical protein
MHRFQIRFFNKKSFHEVSLYLSTSFPIRCSLFFISSGAVECDLLGASLNKSGVIYCMLVQYFCFPGLFYLIICRPDK